MSLQNGSINGIGRGLAALLGITLITTLLSPLGAQSGSGAREGATVLARDFALLMDWFPGVYDNQEQVYFEGELDVPEDERHGRVRSHFFPVDLPWLGEYVFYVQQDQDDDPSNIYRQRFYRFTIDEERDAARLEIFSPKSPEALVGAHLDPGKLAGLEMDGLTKMPDGCDVFWQRQANQFLGSMDEGACRIVSQRSGRTIIISDDLVLTEDQIWIRDRAVDEDGNYVFGNKAGIHHKLYKVRPFHCWFGIRKKHSTTYTFMSRVLLDDGGRFRRIKSRNEPEIQEFDVKIRHVRWPTGTSRHSLVLYVHEPGQERALSYAWADPAASFVGINLRSVQGSCTVQPSTPASWSPEPLDPESGQ